MIPYARPKILTKDIKRVNKVLNSQYLTTGPNVKQFEYKLSRKFGSKYAVSVNSATSALHLSCLAMGLSKGDYLWTSSITFVASANCALYCSAKVDLIDIDPKTLNISILKLKEKLKISKKKNKLPKILIPVHLGGNPCDMSELKKLSRIDKFKILEDASHAVGSKYNNNWIGSCKYSDACVFSFHPVKIITSGEGGAMLTNNKKIFNKFSLLKSHGIVRKTSKFSWYYEQKYLGYNYRLDDIGSSLGISQLSSMNNFIKERNKIVKYYKENLLSKNISFQEITNNSSSSYHLFIIRSAPKLRNLIYNKLRKNGIITSFHYIPIYRHPFYKKFRFSKKEFSVSEQYFKDGISIPIYPGLERKIQKKIIGIINKILISKDN